MADCFMRIEDSSSTAIRGGSIDEDCPGWIEIDSFSCGTSSAINISGSTNSVAGRPNIQDVNVSKRADCATGAIMAASINQDVLKLVTIRQYAKAGKGAADDKTGNVLLQEIEMGDVYISSFQQSSSDSSGYESIVFTPMKFVVKRSDVNPQTGVSDGVSVAGFNQQTNKFTVEAEEDVASDSDPADAEGLSGSAVL